MKDLKITYLSLVDKAANKTKFLVTKNASGSPKVVFSSRIIKSANHTIVGIVYEPLVGDAHDNFMSADEIKKAADWFNENGLGADLQHNEVVEEGVTITKSYVLEEDTNINGVIVASGAWVAEASVNDDELWSKIEKKEITGWSMGGEGTYIMEDVAIKKDELADSIVGKLLKAMNLKTGTVMKGEFLTKFKDAAKKRNFWAAFDILQSVLYPWETNVLQDDPAVIAEALSEFSTVLTDILTQEPEAILKSFALVTKSGKSISASNKKKLKSAQSALTEVIGLEEDEEEEEGEVMKAEDIKSVATEVAKIMKAESEAAAKVEQPVNVEVQISKAVEIAMGQIKKDMGVEDEVPETLEDKVVKAVAKAMEPIYAKRQISKQLDTEVKTESKVVRKGYMNLIDGGAQ